MIVGSDSRFPKIIAFILLPVSEAFARQHGFLGLEGPAAVTGLQSKQTETAHGFPLTPFHEKARDTLAKARQQPTEVIAPVPPLIPPKTTNVHTLHGEATQMRTMREVGDSDPILKAIVVHGKVPIWTRGVAICFILACLMVIYLKANSEEATDNDAASTQAVAADAIMKVGPRCPALHEAVDNKESVASLIKKAATRGPEKAAILDCDGNVCFTYGELTSRFEALSASLLGGGLDKGDVVATVMKCTPQLFVVSLGIINARMVWAPLDGNAPVAWRHLQLRNMGGRLQLVSEDQCSSIIAEEPEVPVWCIDVEGKVVPGHSQHMRGVPRPGMRVHVPDDSVLIIHTSGSSGRPKPILYQCPMMLHSVITFAELCSMDESTVQLLKTPSTWAVVEFELFPALVYGGSCVVDWQCALDFGRLARVIDQRNVSVLITSAPVVRSLLDDHWSYGKRPTSLRHVMNVGAGIPLELCKNVCQTLGHGVKVHNSYATTETTTLIWSFTPEDDFPSGKGKTFAPAGVPDFDVQVYLVDPDLKEVPVGQVGEICMAGMFLATGYLGDENATRERFLNNPFGVGRMYRTGDLGRWIPDPVNASRPVIQVCGRADRQTNIRGMRVAPEDVELVIRKVPGVGEGCVVVGKVGGVAQCLVACVAPASGCTDELEGPVKKQCEEQLPKHMRPEIIMEFKALPKLANGKIDMVGLGNQASEVVASSESSVPDSLGLTRKIGKDAINEMDTMSAARGIGILPVLLFHWYYMPIVWYQPEIAARQFPFPSILFMNIVVGMNWPMQLFVITSGFQDRGSSEDKRAGDWKGDLMVFVLLLLMYRPIPFVLEVMCWARHGFSGPLDTYKIEAQTGIRWYLYFFLICRLLSKCAFAPLLAALRHGGQKVVAAGSSLMVILGFGIAWVGETKTKDGRPWWEVPNACPGFEKNSSVVATIAWFLPGVNEGPSSDIAYCWLVPHQTMLWYFAIYVAVWWCCTPIVRWFKAHTPRIYPSIVFATFVLIALVFYYLEQYQLHTTTWEEPDAATWFMVYLVDLCIACSLIFTLALAVRWKYLHYSGLVFMGQYSLGTYIMHIYMWGEFGILDKENPKGLIGVPAVVDGVRAVEGWPGGSLGFPQVLMLLVYPIIFMLTIGPLFQLGAVAAFNRSVKWIETRLART